MSTQTKTMQTIELNQFERDIAQRLMISIRYFCSNDNKEQQQVAETITKKNCNVPVTKLPKEIKKLITETGVGGVVLFSENIGTIKQVIQLTADLQQAARKSKNKKSLFIAIDQEGGRVVRLNRKNSTAFSGNMAIGATYPEHNIHYARHVGKIIGQELNALGINLNFSPNVDVNSDPNNPVINVRSFGQEPKIVAKLGIAMMDSLQQQKVIATLKHFPGHGNTSIDSHTGLPQVNDEKETIEQIDLVPFQLAIEQSNPGMIMTAHIQYPSLDSSTILSKNNEEILVPATMSKKILTELLRDKMGFKGVVITDALNMAGISGNFSLEDATAESLMAGADIALMPFRIRREHDIELFKQFIRRVSTKVLQDSEAKKLVAQSIHRIDRLKNEYGLFDTENQDFDQAEFNKKNRHAEITLASLSSRVKQKHLAIDSITLLKNKNNLIPFDEKKGRHFHVIAQDQRQLEVVKKALNKYWSRKNSDTIMVSYSLIANQHKDFVKSQIVKSDLIIAFYSTRRESAVVKGEVDDLKIDIEQAQTEVQRMKRLMTNLTFAKSKGNKVIVVGMYSPFDMRPFSSFSDGILVAYDASIYRHPTSKKLIGVTYDAVIAALLGVNEIKGTLPVSME